MAKKPARITKKKNAMKKKAVAAKSKVAPKKSALKKACGHEVFVMSGVSGEGVGEVLRALAKFVAERRTGEKKAREPKRDWMP